jgi:hypothetical protein
MSPEIKDRGADGVETTGRQHPQVHSRRERRTTKPVGPPGSETRACRQGLSRNLGDLLSAVSHQRSTVQPSEPKEARPRLGRSRSAVVVAMTQGNQPEGTLNSQGLRRDMARLEER